MRYSVFLAPMILGALALTACAEQPKASAAELEAFDPPTVRVRGDVVPNAQQRFARFDKNKDGFVTVADFPRNGDRRVVALDGNKDGKVSRSEFVEGALNRFDRFDADQDGQVTPQERAAVRTTTG